MEPTIFSLMIGIGLSAACGFRVFVPLLVLNLAARGGYLTLAGSFEWMGSTPALVAFATATALEIGAYYIPFVDNVLDVAAGPSAVLAGILTTASQVADMHPMVAWSVAIIAGGGAAGAVQGLTTVTRQASSLATAGFGNPILSTLENGASIAMAVLAIVLPFVAAFCLLVLLYFAARKIFFKKAAVEVA